MAITTTIVTIVCLVLCCSIPRSAKACKFAELMSGQKTDGEPWTSRVNASINCLILRVFISRSSLGPVLKCLSGVFCRMPLLHRAITRSYQTEYNCTFRFLDLAYTGRHGRVLLANPSFNDTNKDEAIAASDERAKATAESIIDYIKKATPTTIRDLLTPVGNFTGKL